MTARPLDDHSRAGVDQFLNDLPPMVRGQLDECARLGAEVVGVASTLAKLWAVQVAPVLATIAPDINHRAEVHRQAGIDVVAEAALLLDVAIRGESTSSRATVPEALTMLERAAAGGLIDAREDCPDRCWDVWMPAQEHDRLTRWERDGAAGVVDLMGYLFLTSPSSTALGYAGNFRSFAERHTWVDRDAAARVVDAIDDILERQTAERAGTS